MQRVQGQADAAGEVRWLKFNKRRHVLCGVHAVFVMPSWTKLTHCAVGLATRPGRMPFRNWLRSRSKLFVSRLKSRNTSRQCRKAQRRQPARRLILQSSWDRNRNRCCGFSNAPVYMIRLCGSVILVTGCVAINAVRAVSAWQVVQKPGGATLSGWSTVTYAANNSPNTSMAIIALSGISRATTTKGLCLRRDLSMVTSQFSPIPEPWLARDVAFMDRTIIKVSPIGDASMGKILDRQPRVRTDFGAAVTTNKKEHFVISVISISGNGGKSPMKRSGYIARSKLSKER